MRRRGRRSPGRRKRKPTLNAIFLPATWGTVVKEQLAPQYEKETGVHVNVQLIGRDAIHEKMATLFAGQDASFDIFNLDYNWIPEFGKAGHLVPLDDVVNAEDKADFLPTRHQGRLPAPATFRIADCGRASPPAHM